MADDCSDKLLSLAYRYLNHQVGESQYEADTSESKEARDQEKSEGLYYQRQLHVLQSMLADSTMFFVDVWVQSLYVCLCVSAAGIE